MINILVTAEQLTTECFKCGGQEFPYQLAVFAHSCVNLVKIIVPIILIVLGVFDMFKAVSAQKEDEMKKAQSIFVKRIISALLVFFVVAIVQFLFNTMSNLGFGGDLTDCLNTFVNGNAAKQTCESTALTQ